MTDYKFSISGYKIVEKLYDGSRTIAYRGYRESDSLPVVIKLLKNPYPSFSELVQFGNQYTIVKNLNSPLIVQTYGLEPYQNSYILVMEDFGGISLRDYFLKNHRVISLREFLKIAISLCDILDLLYHHHVIHKDIKPANILINPENKQVKLIDFSIASLLPREPQSLKSSQVLEGTLSYLSPEQTGRMNRVIDYRTDFYSLGVTFYELLTGILPFSSDDAMELIYCHIAKVPSFISDINSDIPPVIAEIVNKMIAKNPEERYQSAIGLKYDLEKCLEQFVTTDKITNFEIAQQDISDQFIIPEKLYGRENEVQQLLEVFDRVTQPEKSTGAEIILVTGISGIGKTAVVNEIQKPIVQAKGYFIKGKFDQFNRNIPFSGFVEAFRDLMGQLLAESDLKIQSWKSKILHTLGAEAQIIIDVIPELERIIGQQPPATELSGVAAENRFNLLLPKFLQLFANKEHSLVIFLDDLQWADSASLKLIQLLMNQANQEHLLLIGAYRDNEVFVAHPLILTLDEIRKSGATINTLSLQNISQLKLNELVVDTLKCPDILAFPLSQLVYRKTQGNPFFSIQLLKSLSEDGLIEFNPEARCWQCDISQINQQTLTDDVVEFMIEQIRRLPTSTQHILKLAACIGNQFDLQKLVIISELSEVEVAASLWKALQSLLILPQSEIYKFFIGENNRLITSSGSQIAIYKFLHDRVQQAAYALIPEAEKQATHYQIGQLLLKQISPAAREEYIFEIVNQLNYGTALITEPSERDELVQLNFTAAQKAKTATAYQSANEYVSTGLSLLRENAWQHSYTMTLALYELAVEVAFLCGNIEQMEEFIDVVIRHTHTLLAQVNVYRMRIQGHTSRNKSIEAISIGQQFLQQFGVIFPESPTQEDIEQVIQEITELLGNRQIEDLIHLPVMKDEVKLAIIQIASSILTATFIAGSPLFPLLTLLSVKLSIQYGNTSASVFSYVAYSVILCNLRKDIDQGEKFGRLAFHLVSKLDDKAIKPEVLDVMAGFILHRKSHIKEIISLSQEGYIIGLEVGNLMFAGYNIHKFCLNSFWCGQPLVALEQDIRVYCNQLIKLNQWTAINYCRIFWQTILNLLDFGEHPHVLSGEVIQEAEFLNLLLSVNDVAGLCSFYLSKLTLSFGFGSIELSNHYAIECRRYLIGVAGTVAEPAFYFYDSLIILAGLDLNSDQISSALERVAQNQIELEQWAYYAPMNHQHKFDLVTAEKYRVLGNKYVAGDWYDRAILGAKENGYLQEEALGNELAAKFYLHWGKEKIAAGYLQEAYYCYAHWGAKAKTDDLETHYPHLLYPILQRKTQTLNYDITLETIVGNNSDSIHTSTMKMNTALDLATLFKVSQRLSSTIQLHELLYDLTEIILENSGGDRCALLLPNQAGEWLIKVLNTPETTELCSEVIADNTQVPIKLIHYVKNIQKLVVIDSLITDLPIIDEYLTQQQPQSILCLPILKQTHLIGILYLENRFTSNVFTSDRIQVINFICTQAAISLDNAQLYQQSQIKAQELEKSLQCLQQTESQLQESKKFLQLIIDSIPHQIFWKDTNSIYLGCNRLFAESAGVSSSQEIVGKNDYDLCWKKEESDWYRECDCQIIASGIPELGIIETQQQTGEKQTWVEINKIPLRNLDGTVMGILGTYKDITKRKNLEQEMIQSEKMSALGNLVAGVAHEINNPVSFLNGNIPPALEYINDLFRLIDLYQQKYPQPDADILEEIEVIELDYIREDLPQLVNSMREGIKRIKDISTSLKTFSHANTDYPVASNIHDGIDSTLMILKHRLKASASRPEIKVIKNYGDLPLVKCYAGQLNQVFMNILANAIDAIDEINQEYTFAEIRVQSKQITITTALLSTAQVIIKIQDNGKGMTEAVKQKIFNHLFTTKDIGKGTGLGLAIAKQIIEETHNGKLTCSSTLNQGTEFIIQLPV